jgi:act minimal PKS ketosynthase (KS/KS alpha)
MSHRVAVTGIGVVAPGAVGAKQFWELLMAGRPATRTITSFDPGRFRSQMAAECDFHPEQHGLSQEQCARLDRVTQFALVAAAEAMLDSGATTDELAHRVGVSIGTAVGCTQQLEQQYRAVSDDGAHWWVDPSRASRFLYDYFVPSSIAAELAWLVGAEGPSAVVSTGCTSGIDAIGHACELIREGGVDLVIAGGSDAPIAPITVACFDAIKATSPRNDDPETACRPFDRTRNGFVLGEGAAVLVLERLELARARGAKVYGEVAGFGSRSNGYHMTGLRADGRELAAAVTAALDEARLPATTVDYVNAHGTATKQNDRHETAALKHSLGAHAYQIPISSIKPMVGHSLGAIGAIEVATCALALEHGAVPPTANLHEPDPELDLDYVPLVARERAVEVVLTVGSGFGGFQSAMVLARDRGPLA